MSMAQVDLDAGQYDKAREHLESALRVYRQLVPESNSAGASVLSLSGGLLDPHSTTGRFLMERTGYGLCWGRYSLLTGKPGDAAKVFEGCRRTESRGFSGSVASEIGLGSAYEALGRRQDAAVAYRRAIKLIEQAQATAPAANRRGFRQGRDSGFRRSEAYEGLARVLR
jgi:tetratricopeptide (TPR) repeat protein